MNPSEILNTQNIYSLGVDAYLERNIEQLKFCMNKIPQKSQEYSLLNFRLAFLESRHNDVSKIIRLLGQNIKKGHTPRTPHEWRLKGDYFFLKGRHNYFMEDFSRNDFLLAEESYLQANFKAGALRAAINSLLQLREEENFDEHDFALSCLIKKYGPNKVIESYEIQYLFEKENFQEIVKKHSQKFLAPVPNLERGLLLKQLYWITALCETQQYVLAEKALKNIEHVPCLDKDIRHSRHFLRWLLEISKNAQQTPLKIWEQNLLVESFQKFSARKELEFLKLKKKPTPIAMRPFGSRGALPKLIQALASGLEKSQHELLKELFNADPGDVRAEHRLHNLIYRLRKKHPFHLLKTSCGYRWIR
jgi:hypothetical protein